MYKVNFLPHGGSKVTQASSTGWLPDWWTLLIGPQPVRWLSGKKNHLFTQQHFRRKRISLAAPSKVAKVSDERLPRRFERLIVGSSTAKALESRLQRRAPPLPNNITSD
jgi:hypothetical protein